MSARRSHRRGTYRTQRCRGIAPVLDRVIVLSLALALMSLRQETPLEPSAIRPPPSPGPARSPVTSDLLGLSSPRQSALMNYSEGHAASAAPLSMAQRYTPAMWTVLHAMLAREVPEGTSSRETMPAGNQLVHEGEGNSNVHRRSTSARLKETAAHAPRGCQRSTALRGHGQAPMRRARPACSCQCLT